MRATIPPGVFSLELIDNCRTLAEWLRAFSAAMETLATIFPGQAERVTRIVGEVDAFFDEASLSDGVTLAQLLVATELRAGGHG